VADTHEVGRRPLFRGRASLCVTAIFVTHSVEEAVLLADRPLVMGAGTDRSDFRIDLARPRDVSLPEFNRLRRDIARRLTSHLVPSRT
jgi:ABC-type nitrate/sulfonate/bicarbonate transport system ATPase subunit